MLTQSTRRSLVTAGAMLAAGLVAASAAPAGAQSTGLDAHWQAWVGCWQPVASTGTPAPQMVCVVPATGTSGVDLATVKDGQVTSRQRIVATGAHVPAVEGGCSGWRSAVWSSDGERVYLKSQFDCKSGLGQQSNRLIAMLPDNQWVDAKSVTVGKGTGVHIVRYHEASVPSVLQSQLSAATAGESMAMNAARTAASAPVTIADVEEASRHVDAGVVQAWLVERHQDFNVSGKQLVQLADAGVPGSVTDVMVALSYPKAFAINPGSRQGELRSAATQQNAESAYGDLGGAHQVVVLDPYGYGFGYSPYELGLGFYSPFGYSPYGYGYGYGLGGYSPYYGGWYSGRSPVIIVRNPENGQTSNSHGHLEKGRGYVPGGSSSGTHRTAVPRSRTRGSSFPSTSNVGGASARPASSSSGTSAPRTAHRRP
ncbi:MAG TPA: hypothetical protein VFW98_17205 [Gemmatimonadaceae bacterium]|nr:hypothetical protein [Gemmatimonadaceae bacterium]